MTNWDYIPIMGCVVGLNDGQQAGKGENMTLRIETAATAASRYAYAKIAHHPFQCTIVPAEFQRHYDMLAMPDKAFQALTWGAQLAALPFVKVRTTGKLAGKCAETYWDVTPTGDYQKDQRTGRAYAELFLMFVRKSGGNTGVLSQIFAAMPSGHPSVVAQYFGFFIATAAAHGISGAIIGALRDDKACAEARQQDEEAQLEQRRAAGRKGAAVTNAKRAAHRKAA